MTVQLERVLEAWRLSSELHELSPPATPNELAQAEATIRRRLPTCLRRLYEFSNGLAIAQGNLIIDPVAGGAAGSSLEKNGDFLRDSGWPIPDDLVVFGGNGSDDLFGVWIPEGQRPKDPVGVVMVGSVFEQRSFALVGTDLGPFLAAWSAYYLLSYAAPSEALDALGLPEQLRTLDDERGHEPYFAWADPTLPDKDPNPYERGMTAAEIGELVARLHAN